MISGERGLGTIFFLAVILPLVILCFGITVDINRFYRERDRAQDLLDEAALLAAKQIPFQSIIPGVAQGHVRHHDAELATSLQTQVFNDEARVSGTMQLRPMLLSYFGLDTSIPITLSSRAAVMPKDVVLFLDTSSYLAPELSETDTAWGEEAWPAAILFQGAPVQFNGTTVDPRVVTQQCFSPPFSAFKEAAIRLYDYFSASSLNSVGVLTAPGVGEPVSVVREVLPAGPHARMHGGEARFNYYKSGVDRLLSDEGCLRASRAETGSGLLPLALAVHLGYDTPAASTYLPNPESRESNLQDLTSLRGERMSATDGNSLLTRDVIWTKSVHRRYEGSNQIPVTADIVEVIRAVGAALLGAPHREERGKRNQDVMQIAYVLLGDLPWHNGQRLMEDGSLNHTVQQAINRELRSLDLLLRQANRHGMLNFVTTRHQGNYPPECVAEGDEQALVACPIFIQESFEFFSVLRQFSSESAANTATPNLEVHYFRAPDVGSVAQDLLALLPALDHTAVLTR